MAPPNSADCNPFVLSRPPPRSPTKYPRLTPARGEIRRVAGTLVRPLRGDGWSTNTTITTTLAAFYDWRKLTKFPYRRSIHPGGRATLFIDLPASSAQSLTVTPFWLSEPPSPIVLSLLFLFHISASAFGPTDPSLSKYYYRPSVSLRPAKGFDDGSLILISLQFALKLSR